MLCYETIKNGIGDDGKHRSQNEETDDLNGERDALPLNVCEGIQLHALDKSRDQINDGHEKGQDPDGAQAEIH